MALSDTGNDRMFDMELAKKCLDVYSHSTGIGGLLVNSSGETLYQARPCSGCDFCTRLRGFPGCAQKCKSSHLYGCYQAERFGGKYIFFCPFGLTHWVTPILSQGVVRGAVLGGPVLMVNPQDFILDELMTHHGLDEDAAARLKPFIDNIPVVPPDRVESLSELLYIVALRISDESRSQYEDSRLSQGQQADISSYLHKLKTMGGEPSELPAYPIDKERELLSMTRAGDKAGAQKVLNEIFGYIFFSTGSNFALFKARVLELVVLLSRAAVEGGADAEEIFGLNYTFLNEINSYHSVEELTVWLSHIMARFTDCVFNFSNVKHADIIFKATDFIRRNYMRKISLEEVASHVFLSPSYFSKIFKEEMGCSFVTYLNRLRIDTSKKLLLEDNIDLVDISNIVGYEDQSYFSKIFKKLTGVSPGRYRESRGQISTLNKTKEQER